MTARLNLVDSSGWIEYFTASSNNIAFFAEAIEDSANLLVASISILEVFKWVYREHGEANALRAAAVMQQARV